MKKKLSEMTIEELWQLFPIILSEHDDRWEEYFAEEKKILASLLPVDAVITHIGSTAIRGIIAKPIVDILIETGESMSVRETGEILARHGYIRMSESGDRVSLNKGYTEDGFAYRVFHIHVRNRGDNGEILFRDYLNRHEEAAKEYEKLKLGLCKRYEHDRDGYTAAKTAFVEEIMREAKEETTQNRS